MPVLVNYKKCNCAPACFSARACPKDSLVVNVIQNRVEVTPEICGDCPAPCLNFCDNVALVYASNLIELEILRKEISGEITPAQAADERLAAAAKEKFENESKAEKEEFKKVAPLILSSQNFMEEVGQSELPVLVDFWAEWCGPCKQVAPVLDELAQVFSGKIKFTKLNVDEEPSIAGQLNIQSIPTLMVFYQGQVADVIVGVLPKAQLQQRLQRVVEALEKITPSVKDISSEPEKAAPVSKRNQLSNSSLIIPYDSTQMNNRYKDPK